MLEHLSPLDATFLELEEADQSAHMHIGGVLVFEPRPDGSVPSYDEVCDRIGPRIRELPHYCDRLSEPKTGGISWPNWEPDDRFDIRNHISRVTLSPPGDRETLRQWASEFYSQRLDRARPLWEMAVIDGLGDGGWVIATKTHHALVDGVGSVDTAYVLLDSEREPAEPAPGAQPRTPSAEHEDAGASEKLGVLGQTARLAKAPLKLAGRALDVAVHPDKARDALNRASAAAKMILDDEVVAAPRTSLNEPIGGKRGLALLEVELGELKAIKSALGGSVNDVVLAATAGGLRRLLLSRGEALPDPGLRAMVPVNIRQASEALELGNKITSLFVHLPVAVADTAARYDAQREEAEALKSSKQGLGSQTVIDIASLAPPAIHSFLAQSLFATRLFNVTVTNVPGPQMPLYALGAELREIWPLVPLAASHAVGLAVISYNGKLFFCINADRDSMPDLGILSTGIADEIADLSALARVRSDLPGGNGRRHRVEVHEVSPG